MIARITEWFKGLGAALSVGLLAFGAFMAVRRMREAEQEAKRWQEYAEQDKSIGRANEALAQARLHAARAAAERERGLAKLDEIGENDTIADITDSWRDSERVRNRPT